jgi:hypothetical protein
MNSKPEYVYKYVSVGTDISAITSCSNHSDFINIGEYSLANLLNSNFRFSYRNEFNDLFDSKIEFKSARKQEIKQYLNGLTTSKKRKLREALNIEHIANILSVIDTDLNNIIDDILLFCVSERCNSNLMWSHYSNNHHGLCIKLKSSFLDHFESNKVVYSPQLASINLFDIVKVAAEQGDYVEALTNELKNKLLIKLEEWDYENEHRVFTNKGNPFITQNAGISLLHYPKDKFVSSIIFGARMDSKVRQHIVKLYGSEVEYEVAIPNNSKGVIDIGNHKVPL